MSSFTHDERLKGTTLPFPVFIIDTFVAEKCRGNRTAVCILPKTFSNEHLLTIARKFNLPVTAFIENRELNDKVYPIYYYTTKGQIPACGHATLAAAKVICEFFDHKNIRFKTIEGVIIEAKEENEIFSLTYPAYQLQEVSVSSELLDSLGVKDFISAGFCVELETLFIETESSVLKNLKPDHSKLVESNDTIKEVVVTSLSDDAKYDFYLRSFCPWIGIDEDPVTGSVHSVLAGFWQSRLDKDKLRAYQASSHGGEIHIRSFDDKVQIGGRAVTKFRGESSL